MRSVLGNIWGNDDVWEEAVRRRDRCDIASWDQLFYRPTHLVTSIFNYEIRQRLKKAPCFGGVQPRLGQGMTIYRCARQTVRRDGEDLNFQVGNSGFKRRIEGGLTEDCRRRRS